MSRPLLALWFVSMLVLMSWSYYLSEQRTNEASAPQSVQKDNDKILAVAKAIAVSQKQDSARNGVCSMSCNSGSVQEMPLSVEKALKLVITNIPGLPTNKQFALFVHPLTADRYASHAMLTAAWQHPAQTRLIMALIHHLSSKAMFFDVGANIGYFTQLVASLGRRVVAVEPTQYHRTLMQASIAITGSAVSQLVSYAPNAIVEVAGKPARVCLEMPDSANAGNTQVKGGLDCPIEMSAPTTTLEELGTRFGIPEALKVDVEGYELIALRSGHAMFKKHPPKFIVLEYNSITYKGAGGYATLQEKHAAMADEVIAFFQKTLSVEGYVLRDADNYAGTAGIASTAAAWKAYLKAPPGGKGGPTDFWNTDIAFVEKSFSQHLPINL